MNEYHLSKRLETAASYVQKGARLADIGSDHAYLPCYLAQKGHINFAIAGEVVLGPFTAAKKQIEQAKLNEIIEARLGDGLEVVKPADEIDTATICGMGGDLIAKILDNGIKGNHLKGIDQLVLQPNNAELKLRTWLLMNGYDITTEAIIEENEKIYEIIVAKTIKEAPFYSENDYLFGKFLRKEKSAIFIKKWEKEIKKNQYILTRLKQSTKDVSQKQKEIESKIKQIKEEIS